MTKRFSLGIRVGGGRRLVGLHLSVREKHGLGRYRAREQAVLQSRRTGFDTPTVGTGTQAGATLVRNPVTVGAGVSITSTPYAIQTLNAQQLGGVAASEYITNANLGTNVIRNQTTLQTPANFNISGNGFVGGNLGIGMRDG